MRTNIVLDESVINEAFALTGLKTKRELVDFALKQLVNSKKTKPYLSEAFSELRQLNLNDDPFPQIKRKNYSNPFVDVL